MNIKNWFLHKIVNQDRLHIIISGVWVSYWFFSSFQQYLGFQLDRFFNYGILPVAAYYVYRIIRDSRPSG